MQGMERAYDFYELLSCANTLNQLSDIEYGTNGLRFGCFHNKLENIWAKLHPLQEGKVPTNLGDYRSIANNNMLVLVLREGFKQVKRLLRVLNMALSARARQKKWFTKPWKLEKVDSKHMAYVTSKTLVPREDGDSEVMKEVALAVESEALEESGCVSHGEDGYFDDGMDTAEIVRDETHDVF